MKRSSMAALAGAVGLAALLTTPAFGDDKDTRGQAGQFRARLDGYQEVPSISTQASGELRARLRDGGTIEFELRYTGLEGGNPSAAQLHFGQRGTSGGVVAYLCGGGGKPGCPAAAAGAVTGTIAAGDVQALSAQGIAGPADFQEVVRALRAGALYVNVRNASYPNGELRGQVRRGDAPDDRRGPDRKDD